ncbi:hypothetical protein [Roseivivax sp. CAU 1753]
MAPHDLSRLIHRAIAWAEDQSSVIRRTGVPLDPHQTDLARAVGVARPEDVRIAVVDRVPPPVDPDLRMAVLNLGLLGPTMIGITFGHGIYLVSGAVSDRLISHECRHVHQYEQAGSIASFVTTYVDQLVTFGNFDAPLECDARAHEIGAT